jgi:hypothetical protein
MCCICIDWKRGLLTVSEARRNLAEATIDGFKNDEEYAHFIEVVEMIQEVELEKLKT